MQEIQGKGFMWTDAFFKHDHVAFSAMRALALSQSYVLAALVLLLSLVPPALNLVGVYTFRN